MADQLSESSLQTQHGRSVPAKWQERFLLKRIGEEDIDISLGERDAILQALSENARFIQLRKHTIMLNVIKGIDPKWGEANLPPRPREQTTEEINGGTMKVTITNQTEIDEWDALFGRNLE